MSSDYSFKLKQFMAWGKFASEEKGLYWRIYRISGRTDSAGDTLYPRWSSSSLSAREGIGSPGAYCFCYSWTYLSAFSRCGVLCKRICWNWLLRRENLGCDAVFLSVDCNQYFGRLNYIRKVKKARAASAKRTADWKKRKGIGRWGRMPRTYWRSRWWILLWKYSASRLM